MSKKKSEKGFSLIELLVVVVLLAVISVIGMAVWRAKARTDDDSIKAEAARVGASSALESLTQLEAARLEPGGSFTLEADRKIQIAADCTAQTCDWLILPSPNNDSPAKGYPFEAGAPAPLGKTVLLRRWRVDDVDANLGLKEITVAVLTDIESDTPLSIKKVRVEK